jgi:transcriptional regulator with GAF, ATPase, and Fis domain
VGARRNRSDRLPLLVGGVPQRLVLIQVSGFLFWFGTSSKNMRSVWTRTSRPYENEDIKVLTHYSWPGNVRELQNIVECSVILTPDTVLHPPSLPEANRFISDGSRKAVTLADAEREHILQTLRKTNWIVGGLDGAATQLGVKRTTLLDKMRRLGIARPQLT